MQRPRKKKSKAGAVWLSGGAALLILLFVSALLDQASGPIAQPNAKATSRRPLRRRPPRVNPNVPANKPTPRPTAPAAPASQPAAPASQPAAPASQPPAPASQPPAAPPSVAQPPRQPPSPPLKPSSPPSTSSPEVACVVDYLRENLDDADSLQFVRWSGAKRMPYRPFLSDQPAVNASVLRVKFRARNRLGAMMLNEWIFGFVDDRVIGAENMNDPEPAISITLHRRYPRGFFPGE